MKKIWIICLIAILSMLVCSLTNILISSINGGESGKFWNMKSVSRTENSKVKEENISIENIEDIEMNFSSSNVRLIITDDIDAKIVQYSNSKKDAKQLTIEKTSNKIILEEEKRIYLFAIMPTDLYDIYIPKTYTNNLKLEAESSTIETDENLNFKDMNIVLASGDIKFKESLKIDNLKLSTMSGDITINNLESKNCNINTSSGDFEINTLNCEEGKIKSISGDVNVNSINSNKIEIETTSGDIELKNLQGKSNIKTVSGEIEIDNLQGSIEGKSTSGDISLNNFLINSESRIDTVSGEVEIYLDKTSNCNIETKTTSGDTSFPNGRNIVGVEPYNRLYIETTSGDIKVRE